MASRKIIISCAVTGSIHTPSMSPHLPVTAAEIASSALAAAEAGAAIVEKACQTLEHRAAGNRLEAILERPYGQTA